MRKSSRSLTIAVAAGALTLFGAGGALAVTSGGAAGPGNGTPVCSTPGSPLASTPACAPQQQPPGHQSVLPAVPRADAHPPEGGEAPGPTHPLCEGGTPLLGTPACPTK